jgi:hypothetical protein
MLAMYCVYKHHYSGVVQMHANRYVYRANNPSGKFDDIAKRKKEKKKKKKGIDMLNSTVINHTYIMLVHLHDNAIFIPRAAWFSVRPGLQWLSAASSSHRCTGILASSAV